MAGCHSIDWMIAEFCCWSAGGSWLSGVSSLFEGGEGETWFSLNLFNTKMTPSLLVNKGLRGSLIGGLFEVGVRPSGSSRGFRPPWRLWRLCSFFLHPHSASFCLIRLYPLSSASLSISVSLILFFMLSFILDHSFSSFISIPKPPHAFPPLFKCY